MDKASYFVDNKALFGDYGGSHYLFKNGTKSLIESIVNTNKNNINDKIIYNQIVTNIIYNDYYIEVHTRDGKIYYCNKLCITVPPGPLKDIFFNPSLSNKHIESLNKIKMGSYKKIQLEFNEEDVFWNSDIPMFLTYDPKINKYDFYLKEENKMQLDIPSERLREAKPLCPDLVQGELVQGELIQDDFVQYKQRHGSSWYI